MPAASQQEVRTLLVESALPFCHVGLRHYSQGMKLRAEPAGAPPPQGPSQGHSLAWCLLGVVWHTGILSV